MNDYLGRIALRSLDHSPTLDPRLPSLFEPLRDAGPRLPVGDVEGSAAAPEPREAAATRPLQVSGPATGPSVAEGEAWNAAPALSEAAVTRPRRTSGPITGPPESRTPPQASAESEASADHATPDELPRNPISLRSLDRTPAMAARTAAKDPPDLRIPASLPSPSLTLPAAPPLLLSGGLRKKGPSAEDDASPVPIGQFDAVSLLGQPSVRVPPSTRSGLKEQPAQRLLPKIPTGPLPKPPERSRRAERPIVQVTIGRVEVRATPAPVSKTRTRAGTPPVMTLEEYLRQRASGSTR
jgi:hypothetical protein